MHVLCPVVDGANHLGAAKTSFAFDFSRDCFTIRSASGCRQGQQVLEGLEGAGLELGCGLAGCVVLYTTCAD